MIGYQRRFVLFAHAHGMPPGRAPAGYLYTNWIRARWVQWDAITGHHGTGHDDTDHAAFDAWLEQWVGALPREAESVQASLDL